MEGVGSGCVHSQRFDDFDRGGLHENPSVVEDRDRQGTGRASVLEKCSTFRRVGLVETIRNRAALKVIAERMGDLRPAIPNYSDDLESRSVLSGPLV